MTDRLHDRADRRQVVLAGGEHPAAHHRVHAVHWRPRRAPGAGAPTVVAVHGLAGSSLDWARLAPALAERVAPASIWAPDLGGFGRTAPLPAGTGIDANLALLEAFVATVSPEGPVVLVGNSMGGLLSLLLGARRPELVRAMVLLAPASPLPAGRLPDRQVTWQFAAALLPVLGPRLLQRWTASTTPEEQMTQGLQLIGVDSATLEAHVRQERVRLLTDRRQLPYVTQATIQATRSLLLLLLVRRHLIWRAADRVRCPVLLIQGQRDRLVSLEQSRKLARRCSWDLQVYPGHGHAPMIDAPDQVADDIARWLHPGASERAQPA